MLSSTKTTDLYRGLRFAHAQDRLWQMEMMRRADSGSENFGERTLGLDIFLRARPRWPRRKLLCRLPAGAALLSAYAEGVNAFLEYRRPVQSFSAGISVPPSAELGSRGQPHDHQIMALNLSANLNAEIGASARQQIFAG